MQETQYRRDSGTPSISVLIPTYNRAGMLEEAVHSVLRQTTDDWELVIVDDGSTDETRGLVAAWTDSRIRYVYQENKGLAAARNRGLREARGRYVAFLDSDDLFRPDKLKNQAKILDEDPSVGLVAGGHLEVDSHKRPLRVVRCWERYPVLTLESLLIPPSFMVSTVMVRREWLDRVGLFDETLFAAEDWDYWIRLALAGCRMVLLQQIVTDYRVHGNTLTVKHMSEMHAGMHAGMTAVLDKLYAQPGLSPEILSLRGEAYGKTCLGMAAQAFAAGQGDAARRLIKEAATQYPVLLTGNPPKAVDSLVAFAAESLPGGGERFLDMLSLFMPAEFPALCWPRRRLQGLYQMIRAFHHYREAMYRVVVRAALTAAVKDWRWLRNRGWWSVTLRSLKRMSFDRRIHGRA